MKKKKKKNDDWNFPTSERVAFALANMRVLEVDERNHFLEVGITQTPVHLTTQQ